MLFGRDPLDPGLRDSLRKASTAQGRPKPQVLAWALTSDGALVALPDCLAVQADGSWAFVPWHEVLRVSWSEDGRTIRWALTAEPSLERTADVQAPRNLPAVIRERIEQTFLIRQPVELAPGKVATVAARRPADGSGIVAWTVIPGRGVDLSRPALREAADRQLEALRRVWG